MLEPTMIQTRGFRNVDNGFQLRLRLPYYRGLWANLIDGVSVTVDGETVAVEQVGWGIGDTRYSAKELRGSVDARWPVDVPVTLTMPRREPLTIGFHDVGVELRVRMSYIPVELQPTVWTEERRLVITT